MASTAPRRSGRRPGTTATRESILAAGRELFAEHGYRGATVRAIAARARVDPALIRYFFTDKDGLFAATLAPQVKTVRVTVTGALAGDSEGAGERLARAYLGLWEDPTTSGPLLAAVRSAIADERALEMLRLTLTSAVLTGSPPSSVPDAADLRLPLALSHLLGTAVVRHVVQVSPLCDLPVDWVVRLIAPALQGYLTGPLPFGPAGSELPGAIA